MLSAESLRVPDCSREQVPRNGALGCLAPLTLETEAAIARRACRPVMTSDPNETEVRVAAQMTAVGLARHG